MPGTRIAAWVACLFAAATLLMLLPLLMEREVAPPSVFPEPPTFELTRSFADRHDAVVLRAALAGRCNSKSQTYVLVGEPADRLDGRRSLGVLRYPAGIGCSSVHFVEESELEEARATCAKAGADDIVADSFPCLQQVYPGLAGLLSLDLPVYTYEDVLIAQVDFGLGCGPYCGSGWRATLRWSEGRWWLIDTNPTWIS